MAYWNCKSIARLLRKADIASNLVMHRTVSFLLQRLATLPIWKLACVILLFRIAFIVGAIAISDTDPREEFYDEIATNLADGRGFIIREGESPCLYRPPLYPVFLTAVYKTFGAMLLPAIIFQAFLDIGIVIAAGMIAGILFGSPTNRVAALLCGAYPFTALYVTRLLTEVLFVFLLTWAVYLVLRGLKRGKHLCFIGAGIIMGFAILSRFSLYYFIFLLPFAVWISSSFKARALRGGIVVSMTALLVLLPWFYRNFQLTGDAMLLGSGGSYNVWLGNHVATDGMDNDELNEDQLAILKEDISALIGGTSSRFAYENEAIFKQAALEGFAEYPAETAFLVLRKCFRFWFQIFSPSLKHFSIVVIPVQGVVLLLAIAGTFLEIRRTPAVTLLVLMILYFNGIHAVSVATFRYSLQIMPFVLVLTSAALVALLSDHGHLTTACGNASRFNEAH